MPGSTARRRAGGARHDHDAGGDPDVLAAKAALREAVWAALDRPGVARFPKPGEPDPELRRRRGRGPPPRRHRGVAGRRDREVESRLAPVAGAHTRAGRRQGRLHGRPAPRRDEPVLPPRPRAPRRLPARRELDQGRGSQRADRRRGRARAGRPRGDRLRRGRRVGRAPRQGRWVQRPRARGRGGGGAGRRAHRRRDDRPRAAGAAGGHDPDDGPRHPRRPGRHARPRLYGAPAHAAGRSPRCIGAT